MVSFFKKKKGNTMIVLKDIYKLISFALKTIRRSNAWKHKFYFLKN